MKINRVKLNEMYHSITASSKASAERNNPAASRPEKDSLRITNEAKRRSGIQGMAKRIAAEVSEPASAEKLLRLKNEIASGTYRTSSREIAEALCGRLEDKE
ncbi:MAG TPA: hypothetical protein GX701_08820 [Clostridiales bacterium]|jgi:anti-sigma28 factor (negative regulator of flagellin synthesis)|nr:hypothetical protein [Clostridiales bacterium]